MRALAFLLVAGLLTSTVPAEPRVEYRDNARPIRLALPGEAVSVERVEVFLWGPERLSAVISHGPRNPTSWARHEGRALPGLKILGDGFGRFGDPDSAALAFYWSDRVHHGKVTWRRGAADAGRLQDLAQDLSTTWLGAREGGWLATAARSPEGSIVQFHFHGLAATVQVFGGAAEAGRREADKRLRRALAAGVGWEPMLGMHSPSWQAAPESPVGAVMIAGPVLAVVANPGGPETLERLAQVIQRPLPQPPEIGEDPMGTAPAATEPPETERERRWRERRSP